jgi:glucose/arabinose dehydrogenase
MRHKLLASLLVLLALGLTGCRDEATLPVEAGTGADPKLPQPKQRLIPTVDVAHAVGWPQGATPRAASGFAVKAFASGLDHPRWLYVLPDGDVLVAETSAPPQPGQTGLTAWVMELIMTWVGANVPSANRITLLRDADGDGVAETR